MKKILVVLVAGLLAGAVFAGCGSKDSEESAATVPTAVKSIVATKDEAPKKSTEDEARSLVTGTWVVGGFTDYDGGGFSLEDYADYYGSEADILNTSFTFAADGKATSTVSGTKAEGTYTFDGKTLKATFEGTTLTFEYKSDIKALTNYDEETGFTAVFAKYDSTQATTVAAQEATQANDENAGADGEGDGDEGDYADYGDEAEE